LPIPTPNTRILKIPDTATQWVHIHILWEKISSGVGKLKSEICEINLISQKKIPQKFPSLLPKKLNPNRENLDDIELPEDIRVHIIGSILSECIRNRDNVMSCPVRHRASFDRLDKTADLLTWTLLLFLFITKPGWCEAKEEAISDDCKTEYTGLEYRMSFMMRLDADTIYWPTVGIMLIITLLQMGKWFMSKKSSVLYRFITFSVITAIVFLMLGLKKLGLNVLNVEYAGVVIQILTLSFVIVNKYFFCVLKK
jgi:hypothetical protein